MNDEQREEWLDELRFDATMEAYHEAASREGFEAHLKEVIRDERSRDATRAAGEAET